MVRVWILICELRKTHIHVIYLHFIPLYEKAVDLGARLKHYENFPKTRFGRKERVEMSVRSLVLVNKTLTCSFSLALVSGIQD